MWPADFKGHFRTGDGKYCYPLTVTDHFSRRLLLCQGLPSTRLDDARRAFLKLFREVGLPDAIRTDNGSPFASTGIHGLSILNVWWMKLGIVHQRIRPASPQENGQHERMHRELKAETTHPPAGNLKGQQRKLDRFRRRYNEERPYEALDDRVPDSLWHPPARSYPERLPEPEYASTLEVRRVSDSGDFRLNSKATFLSQALAGEYIGLEETGNGIWNIVYYKTLLGRFDERNGRITGTTTL